MKSRAAVALEAGKPLELVEINVEGPKAGEVLVKMAATSVCHTDAFTLSGADRPRMEVNQTSVFATNALPGSGLFSPSTNGRPTKRSC